MAKVIKHVGLHAKVTHIYDDGWLHWLGLWWWCWGWLSVLDRCLALPGAGLLVHVIAARKQTGIINSPFLLTL